MSKSHEAYSVCFFQVILLSSRAATICNCLTIIFAWALCLSFGDIIRLSLTEIIINLLIHSERKRVRISVNAFVALLCLERRVKFDYIISLNHKATRTKFYYYFSYVSYQQEITFFGNAFLNNEKEKWFIERLCCINEFDTIVKWVWKKKRVFVYFQSMYVYTSAFRCDSLVKLAYLGTMLLS